MLNNITKFYIFLDKLDKIIIQNLSKLKNYSIIYNPKNNNFDINNLVKMQTYCKKRGINFYIKDDYKNANKFGAYGICLTSQNKSMGRGKLELKLKKIGIVHNQIEYARKCGQFCTMIMLSPIFYFLCNSRFKMALIIDKHSEIKRLSFKKLVKFLLRIHIHISKKFSSYDSKKSRM
jgi:hypothetical protein